MPKHASVSPQLVRNIRAYLMDRNKDFVKICALAGIAQDADILQDPNARLAADDFLRLFKEAAKASEDPYFGLNLGKAMARSYPGGSILLNMMLNSPSVGAALDLLFRYHDLMSDALHPFMTHENRLVKIAWKTGQSDFIPHRQIVDTLISLFTGILALIGDGGIELHVIRFAYPEPAVLTPYEQRLQAPLTFNQPQNEILFEARFLSLPVPLADKSLLEVLESHAQKRIHQIFLADAWSQNVAGLITGRLMRGEPFGLNDIARELGTSNRSLQERLKREGTSYREILSRVRKEMALNYLNADQTDLCDLAFLLGFSEQSAFNHAFKKWTGLSPKAYLEETAR